MIKKIYPWQQKQWQTLNLQRQQDRLHHAFLLYGGAGLGKRDFVNAFAQTLFCQQLTSDQFACGQCRACQLFSAGTHPDYYFVTPQEKSKLIKIDQMRELIIQLNQSSQMGGYQIAVIYPAESMNRATANALLKTLEEPAGDVLFFLISDQLSNLPATILSRCQKVYFSATNDAGTIEWLQQRVESRDIAEQLLRAAEYAPLRALQLAEADYLSVRDQLLQQLLQISDHQIHPCEVASYYLKHNISLLFLVFMSLLADISRLQLRVDDRFIANCDQKNRLIKLSQKLSERTLQDYLLAVQQARMLAMGPVALNLQLLLEKLFIEWMNVTNVN